MKLHPLEITARECMKRAQETNNIWVALVAHNCAISIRNLPEWQVFLLTNKKDNDNER